MIKAKGYYRGMSLLALTSVILVLLESGKFIQLQKGLFHLLDGLILLIFLVDYVIRLQKAEKKVQFVNHNFFDLLTILPLLTFFSPFQSATWLHLALLARLMNVFRLLALSRRLRENIDSFLYRNGFIYLVYTSFTILFFAAFLFSVGENETLINGLWWALETAATVGYGDFVPTSNLGKLAGVIVMLLGVGFIGMLSSSLTRYYLTREKQTVSLQDFKRLEGKIDQLLAKKTSDH